MKHKPRIKAKRDENIRELASAGHTPRIIAPVFGICPTRVRQILKRREKESRACILNQASVLRRIEEASRCEDYLRGDR